MSNYDIHLIIKQLTAQFPLGKLRAIPGNTEKYISVSLDVAVREYRDKGGKRRDSKIHRLPKIYANIFRISGLKTQLKFLVFLTLILTT